jgi:5-dehydro-2-deoxygluconokinase
MENKDLELVCIGRSCVDLYGQQFGCPLEDMTSFSKFVGGSPMNISIGSARLGLKVAAITGVGNEHMGRFIVKQLAAENIDISQIRYFEDRLTAMVILGIKDQDNFPMIQYRVDCADMGLRKEDINPDFLTRSKAVLITGTHLSTPETQEATLTALKAARNGGCLTIMDIDFRPNLWRLASHNEGEIRFVASEEVTRQYQIVLPMCDLIVGTEEEFHIAGGISETIPALRKVRELTNAILVCKVGSRGCVGIDGEVPDVFDEKVITPGFPVEVYNSVGAGDGFMSGFLRGWLRDEELTTCCRYANAAGAFAVSRLGCSAAYPSWEELSSLITHGSKHFSLRNDAYLNQIHWSTNRGSQYPNLCVLAFDHRSLFSSLAEQFGCDELQIAAFKNILFQAAIEVKDRVEHVGIIADDKYSRDTLFEAMDHDIFIARPIERPDSQCLSFSGGLDVAITLREWPRNHVVKCLIFAHPDDDPGKKELEKERLRMLLEACRATEHELMLELICSKSGPINSDTVSRQMESYYKAGIYPDWWKIETPVDKTAWAAVSTILDQYDPFCRGILLLGLNAPAAEIEDALIAALDQPWCKGFAVGRTIFLETAKEWLSGKINNETAQKQVAKKFGDLVDVWLNK